MKILKNLIKTDNNEANALVIKFNHNTLVENNYNLYETIRKDWVIKPNDNIKYLVLRSAEDFKATISAYTYPDEFEECDGSVEAAPGLYLSQQARKTFGFAYRTKLGNDVEGDAAGYVLHLVYGATASPSQRSYKTINESPEPIEFSWEVETTPVAVSGHKPTAHLRINSLKADSTKLAALEAILFGGENEPRLPLPDEVHTLLSA